MTANKKHRCLLGDSSCVSVIQYKQASQGARFPHGPREVDGALQCL